MKASVLILLILFSGCTALSARQITGIVVDASNGEPVAGAAVYLDETSLFTVTDAEGKFRLNLSSKNIYVDVVFSHLNYEKKSFPFGECPDTVLLRPIRRIIEEIVVRGSPPFSRQAMLLAFRHHFLGSSAAGRSCTILNEEDLRFSFDTKTNTLKAYALQPLTIENPYLGYRVRYELTEFSLTYNSRSLDNAETGYYRILGNSSYEELQPEDAQTAGRRKERYERSFVRFFHLLAAGQLEEAGFKLRYKRKQVKPELFFRMAQRQDYTLVRLTMKPSPAPNSFRTQFPGNHTYIELLVKESRNASSITFLTDNFIIDPFGNTSTPTEILFRGAMAKLRVGDMLPRDYLPAAREEERP